MEHEVSLVTSLERIMGIKCIDRLTLSEASGVPVHVISDLLGGVTTGVPLESIFRLAYALEVSAEYLLGLSNHYVAATSEEYNPCEIKGYKCLKYHDSRYLSWDINQFPLTLKISQARRFYSIEDIASFMANSNYRPQMYKLDPADFEIVDIEVSYKEKANTLEGET